MTAEHRRERWLMLGTVVVLALAVGFITLAAMKLRQRQLKLADVALERSQQMLRVRLDGMVQELDKDLVQEAFVAQQHGRLDTAHLGAHWMPLFASHAAIVSVRLTDEQGNGTAMVRGAERELRITVRRSGSDEWPLELSSNARASGTDLPDNEQDQDPRTTRWFSKALEDARGAPTWNLHHQRGRDQPLLQLSYLIRSMDSSGTFSILMFEVDLTRSPWVDTRSVPHDHYGVVLHDGDGNVLSIPDALKDPVIAQAEQAALGHWVATKTREPFSVAANGRLLRAIALPYLLNGETLYGTTLVDVEMIALWTSAERNALLIASALLALLIILLGLLWLGHRKGARHLERQARRSETQERKLAKALGEREVLNREVHHRVKNNLQVVSSLLNLQLSRMEDEAVRTEFKRGKHRIDTIALVHHKLYGLKDLRNVDLRLFFNALVEAQIVLYRPASDRISCELQTSELKVDQDTAIELGIILCELLGNTMQHAFPYATGGHVDIQVQPVEGDLYRLLVKDNGRGLKDGHADGPGKLGMEIVEALAEQLDGSFHTRSNGGTVCEVTFRMHHQQPSSFTIGS